MPEIVRVAVMEAVAVEEEEVVVVEEEVVVEEVVLVLVVSTVSMSGVPLRAVDCVGASECQHVKVEGMQHTPIALLSS